MSPILHVDTVVGGAGVIGLAVARDLSLKGRKVLLVEKESGVGRGISSRNSEVIHAGIYYPPEMLKSKLCVTGKQELYRYCESRRIPHRQIGKLIVATSEAEICRLHALLENGHNAGVDGLRMLSRTESERLEPSLRCVGSLYSSSSGIVDSHALMLALQTDAESAGAICAFLTKFVSVRRVSERYEIELCDQRSQETFLVSSNEFVNATGLSSHDTADCFHDFPKTKIPSISFARGNYFALKQRSPFRRLIYPLPPKGGLGVHLTLDLGGAARFGPDVEWIETVDYFVNVQRVGLFYREIRKFWPELPDDSLTPAFAGVRPKLGNDDAPHDFLFLGPEEHGMAGCIHLFGIESPGLTACLAIADHVSQLLLK